VAVALAEIAVDDRDLVELVAADGDALRQLHDRPLGQGQPVVDVDGADLRPQARQPQAEREAGRRPARAERAPHRRGLGQLAGAHLLAQL
jgi:hypothetical protein